MRAAGHSITGVRVQGGQVQAVYDARGNPVRLEAPASLAGVVADSAGTPLVDARVFLLGTADTVLTDERGRFRFPALLPGNYLLTYAHPALDSAGWRQPAWPVSLYAGAADDTVHLMAPSRAAIAARRRAARLGDIGGQVVEAGTGRPVSGAAVRLSGAPGPWITDSLGGFRFRGVQPGTHVLTVSDVAHGTTTDTLQIEPGEHVSVRFQVRGGVFQLQPLVVTGTMTPLEKERYLGGFYTRVDQGWGTYIKPAQVQRREGWQVSDFVSSMAGGTAIHTGQGMADYVIIFRRVAHLASPGGGGGGGGLCLPLLYVDGHLTKYIGPEGELTLNVVPPADIEAIEVYKGAAELPAEFMDEGAECGAIVVWTHRGQVAPGGGS